MFKKYLKDNTCFIVPSNIKKEILLYISNNKLLVNISFYTLEELKKNIFFDYDEKTIYFLSKKYNLKYEDALLKIQNMYYINDSLIENKKIEELKEMKKYLDENDLLSYNENFLSFINKKNIVTTYNKTTFINEKILTLLNNITYLKKESEYQKEIYEFKFIEEEVEYVAYKIATLIEKGGDINSIKLVNVSDEYKDIIEKIFSFYNLPINLNKKTSLFDLNIIKDFIELLKNNPLEEALNLFKNKYDISNNNHLEIYNKIIKTMNKYYFISDYSNDIEFIIKGFKNSFIKEKKLNNCIECINIEEIFNEENYYFLIGFNNRFPSFYKDEDYLSDDLKTQLSFKKSNEINKFIKEYYINKINSTKNLMISYKLSDYFNSYLVSPLIDDIKGEVIKNPLIDIKVSYSPKFDQIKLSKYLDDFYKFSLKNPHLKDLYNTYNSNEYNSYDNRFKGIDKNNYSKFKHDKLSLSYSSLDNFYKCNFMYYLNNLLNEKEDNFSGFIGDVYHNVLSKMYDKDFDFEKEYNYELSKRNLSDKEKVLLLKLKEELLQNITLLQNQLKESDFKKDSCEKEFKINIEGNSSITLTGKIDKIMSFKDKKENITYDYIVDYKTGNPSVSFDNLKHGLNMQLAIYMYILKNSNEYKDDILSGCYLQKILEDDLTKEELKLDGYTYNDNSIISKMDYNYQTNSFISGLKRNPKRKFTTEQYEEIINTVDTKIKEAIKTIKEAEFNINPKIVKGKNISCEHCKFKDICYKSYKDSIIISQEEGDDNE